MDFFGILFDIKNGKKVPYSKTYFDTLFAAKLGGSDVKTLTGALPLTFTTSEAALRSWTIYGNNYEHKYSTSGTLPRTFTTHTAGAASDWVIEGNDNIGKNIFQIIPSEQVITETGTLHFSSDAVNGVISVSGTGTGSESSIKQSFTVTKEMAGNCYYSADFSTEGSTTTYDLYLWDKTTSHRIYKWDGVTNSPTIKGTEYQECLLVEGHSIEVSMRIHANVTTENLTFKPMIRPADTSADFEPYQVGVGQRTKNKLEITATSTTTRGVTFTVNKTEGTITANGKASSSAYLNLLINAPSGNYYYSGCALGGSASTYDLFAWDDTISGRPKKWDGETNVDSDYGGTSQEIKVDSEHSMQLTIRIHSGYTCNNLVFKPMLRAADTDAEFIPYGYEVPLTISQTGQTDKNYDIFIGDSPLTEGESVSKTSTGVDIATTEGENTISTTLYNKPEMSIEGVDYVGVGEPRGQGYSIALQCVGELSPYNPNAPESDTNYVYNATNFTLDTDARYRTALIDLGKRSIKIFTIGKTKGETYKIQAIDYMGEWGGVDHYSQIGQTITPTEPTYTGSTAAQYLLVTYYDSEIDTLSPQEIRESITVSATVDTHTFIPIDAPLTEGQTVSKESTGVDIETFPNAVNSLRYTTDYSDFEMSITYKGG